MKFFKDFYQNSGGQSQYPKIQMTIKFLKSQMITEDYRILQELDDHRILMKFSRAFDQNSYVKFQGF